MPEWLPSRRSGDIRQERYRGNLAVKHMRITIDIKDAQEVDWSFLRRESHFLYRRIADRDRAALGVGVLCTVDEPEFGDDGRVDDWVFGAIAYEWQDARTSGVHVSADPDQRASWFLPRYVVEWSGDAVRMHVMPGDEQQALAWASGFFRQPEDNADQVSLSWSEQVTRERYLAEVQRLLAHIQRGDIYEVNFCTARSASAPGFDPFNAFGTLLSRSPAPFAAFHRAGDSFALCASPERFLAFQQDRVIGQPMKGTRPRSSDPAEDARLAGELASDAKERSENIMALDVMRHDLSRIAASGTVKVDELCAVLSLPKVHQMTSTVSATLRAGITPLDVLRAAFPMASMTGAPKVRAMQLIAAAEGGPRGLFSGTLGFFAPDGTGDFNVVIRTAMFDARSGMLSVTTGSAITALCDPEQEWEECQLKARSVIDAIAHA